MGRITILALMGIFFSTTAQATTCADTASLTLYGNGYDNTSYPLSNAGDGDTATYAIASNSPYTAEIHNSSGTMEDFDVTIYNPTTMSVTVNLRINSGGAWSTTYSETIASNGAYFFLSLHAPAGTFDYYEVSLSPASVGDVGLFETVGYLADCDFDGVNDTDNGGSDCDDSDASVFPTATETSNGVDDDCDGTIDEGTSGYDDDGDGMSEDAGDCDDANSAIYIGAPETFYDGVDSDCGGDSDYDADDDGYESDAYSGTDCNDSDATVNPAATETANGVDDNCDGDIDEGGDTFDDDGDGYSEDTGDCDDTDASIAPGATETYYDGVDQDCGYDSDYDADYDGYDSDTYGGDDCNDADSTISPGTEEIWYDGVDQDCVGDDDYDQDWDGYQSDAYGGTDCDDTANNIYVGATDTWYDGIDSDCGGNSDFDQDGDGDDSSGYTGTDCDDTDSDVHVGATEWCNEVDDDCDGTVDDWASDSIAYFPDEDGDGWGFSGGMESGCEIPEGYTDVEGDCNDSDAAYHPGASETDCADPNDYNCDGSTGYDNADGDGYSACEECDDSVATTYPGASEYCNEVDDDCDSVIDEDAVDPTTWYADADGDGYGDAGVTSTGCEAPEGFVAESTDCADTYATIHPGAEEVCNTVDDDCDGTADEDGVCDTGDTGDTADTGLDDTGPIDTGDTDSGTGDTHDTADVIFPVDDTGRDGKFAGGGGFSCGGCATGGGNFASLWMGMISLMLMLRRQK